ncbi:putative transcription factor MADS-type1 family [Medicago truncatula]|uniref:MADS-box transcription factor family protein n=1 Tax=Medicago truncatula TaxID=3880 RepID=G7IAU3_MEDTR|nr:agamous-like MADS-box protein AGL62 [Medicago truncatula]AES62814.1 MADS-box transcription factor family protein [Medicago truncatula]RHN82310.1 putative transcription factor MADS-type1 family [Medicago truncatula]
MSSVRKGRGRQKIEMKKISNESNLQVTFSKHHNGLFKKASELCTLCGADVALVVFSPSGKVFSFGHPNLDTVIDRFLSLIPTQNDGTMQFIEAHRNANVRELNAQLTQINNTLDAEKKIGDELSNLHKETEAKFWWACVVDGMNRDQLEIFKKALEELKKLVIQHAATRTLPFFVGNTSSSNIYLHHQPNPQQAEMFPPQIFQNAMLQLQTHFFDGSMIPHHVFNNMV